MGFPKKASFCFYSFFHFCCILYSLWDAAEILLVPFLILRGLLGLVWAVFRRPLKSFVRLWLFFWYPFVTILVTLCVFLDFVCHSFEGLLLAWRRGIAFGVLLCTSERFWHPLFGLFEYFLLWDGMAPAAAAGAEETAPSATSELGAKPAPWPVDVFPDYSWCEWLPRDWGCGQKITRNDTFLGCFIGPPPEAEIFTPGTRREVSRR